MGTWEFITKDDRPDVSIDLHMRYETFDKVLELSDLHEVSPSVYLRRLIEADINRWEFEDA